MKWTHPVEKTFSEKDVDDILGGAMRLSPPIVTVCLVSLIGCATRPTIPPSTLARMQAPQTSTDDNDGKQVEIRRLLGGAPLIAAVSCDSGVVVLGGNVLSPPYELRFDARGRLVVNGRRIAGTDPPPKIPSRSDSMSFDLFGSMRALVRSERAAGVPESQIADHVEQLFRSSKVVQSVARDSTGFYLHLTARPQIVHYISLPFQVSEHETTEPEREVIRATNADRQLRELKKFLYSGGGLLLFRNAEIHIPPGRATKLREVIAKLQSASGELTGEDRAVLEGVQAKYWNELRTPLALAKAEE